MPTFNPRFAAATAKLTVTEDFPTPPLPDAIPNTRVNESGWANGINFSRPPLIIFFTLFRCSSLITPNSISTFLISAKSIKEFVISDCNLSFIGQPTMVSNIFNFAMPSLTVMVSTIPSSVIGLCNSGSFTLLKASLICSTRFITNPDLI